MFAVIFAPGGRITATVTRNQRGRQARTLAVPDSDKSQVRFNGCREWHEAAAGPDICLRFKNDKLQCNGFHSEL